MIRHRRALYNVTDEKQDGEQVTSNKQKRRADSTAVIRSSLRSFRRRSR
jgi:hypothetical protein